MLQQMDYGLKIEASFTEQESFIRAAAKKAGIRQVDIS